MVSGHPGGKQCLFGMGSQWKPPTFANRAARGATRTCLRALPRHPTPWFVQDASKVAKDGHCESLKESLKPTMPTTAPRTVVGLSLGLGPTHVLGSVCLPRHAPQGPCQTIHWLPGVSITAQRAQNQAGVRHHFDPISRKIGHVSRVFLVHSGATRRFHW